MSFLVKGCLIPSIPGDLLSLLAWMAALYNIIILLTNAGDPLKKDSAREYAGWVRVKKLQQIKKITVGKSVHFQGQMKNML